MPRCFIAVLTLFSLVACAGGGPTAYAPATADSPFGYAEQAIAPDRFRVRFSGNSVTSRDQVQNFLLVRAAELTVERGGDYFIITEQDVERDTRFIGDLDPDPLFIERSGRNRIVSGGIGTTTLLPINRYDAYASILIRQGPPPQDDANAYDARAVLQTLGSTVQRPIG